MNRQYRVQSTKGVVPPSSSWILERKGNGVGMQYSILNLIRISYAYSHYATMTPRNIIGWFGVQENIAIVLS